MNSNCITLSPYLKKNILGHSFTSTLATMLDYNIIHGKHAYPFWKWLTIANPWQSITDIYCELTKFQHSNTRPGSSTTSSWTYMTLPCQSMVKTSSTYFPHANFNTLPELSICSLPKILNAPKRNLLDRVSSLFNSSYVASTAHASLLKILNVFSVSTYVLMGCCVLTHFPGIIKMWNRFQPNLTSSRTRVLHAF